MDKLYAVIDLVHQGHGRFPVFDTTVLNMLGILDYLHILCLAGLPGSSGSSSGYRNDFAYNPSIRSSQEDRCDIVSYG